MNISLAQIGARYDAETMRQRTEQIERAFQRVLSTESASAYALLVSPNQSVWKVTVDDAGTLHATKVMKGVPI